MNIKIARTLLILCGVYIFGFYIIKFIFPEYLLLAITDERVLQFGKFIESNNIYLYGYQLLSTFITFYLFLCASRGSFKLKWYELLYLIIAIALCRIVYDLSPNLYVHTSISCMFLLSLLCKGKLSYTTIAFIVHGYLSQFLFSIRGFETIVANINVASAFVLTLECYVWLISFALLFYLKERKNELCSTIPKQNG